MPIAEQVCCGPRANAPCRPACTRCGLQSRNHQARNSTRLSIKPLTDAEWQAVLARPGVVC